MERAAGTATRRRDMSAAGEDAALAELELARADGGYRVFSASDWIWAAITGGGQVLTGFTPGELDRKIRTHWQVMQ